MLQPKRQKYRRPQKGKMKGNAHRGHELAFGSFGIKTLEEALITARQIEAARQAVTRYMKREGQIWIRIFPDKPITKKPLDKPRVCRWPSPKRLSVWPPKSCPSPRSLLLEEITSNNLEDNKQ